MRHSVVVAGRLILDFIMDLQDFPTRGHSVLARSLRPEAGGKGLNIAAGTARLGLHTYLLAKVGGDEVGRALMTVLDREGVDKELVLVDSDGSSGIIVGLIDNASSEEAHIIADPEASRLTEAYVEQVGDVFGRVDAAIITPGISAQTAVRAVELCAGQITPPVVLFQFRPHEFLTPEQIETLAKGVNFLFGTVDNLRYLISKENPIEEGADSLTIAQQVLNGYGFQAVCVTDGVFGGAYVDERESLRFLPFPTTYQPLDRTGAIDAFSAGFIANYLETRNVHEALRFATAAGRLAAQAAGGYPAMPLRNSVVRFLNMRVNQDFNLFTQGPPLPGKPA